MQKAIEELRATETELDDVQEQIRAAQDVVDRIEVRAPVRGIVVKLNQHTAGGVIAAGAVILELLPVNDELIIEARVNPSEISHVKAGQGALVRLTALNQRLTPMIEGRVIYLSADAVPAATRGQGRARDAVIAPPTWCACGSTSRTCAARSRTSGPRPACPPTSSSRPASARSSTTSCGPCSTASPAPSARVDTPIVRRQIVMLAR